jgi:recombination protein RecA
MAVKKEETVDNSKDAGLKAALSEIQKQFGKEAIISFTDNSARKELEYISSGSLSLDLALGGKGYPKGRIVELFSEPSCGKTTICLHAVAEVQKQGGRAAYFDLENALDLDYATKLGVDIDTLIFSQPDSGEQALEMANILMKNNAVDVVVFDSVAAMIPRAELEGNIGDSFIGTTARLLSQGLKKIAQSAARANCLVMFVNQTRNKIGVMYGCFDYDSPVLVESEDGSRYEPVPIGKIVDEKIKCKVASWNFDKNCVESKDIVNWYDNGRCEHLYEVKCVGDCYGEPYDIAFTVADDHTFITPKGEKPLSKLKKGDLVYTLDSDVKLITDFESEDCMMFHNSNDPFLLGAHKILSIKEKKVEQLPEHKYDLQIEGNSNYFVDGVLVHNSPLTTSGGEALKFYATQRLHITRTSKPLEDKGEAVGNETKVKVVKNKVAPPFRIAEFVIEYNKGISIDSEVFKLGVKLNLIDKAGSFYSYEPASFRCQGEAKFKEWLHDNPEIKAAIIARIKEAMVSGEADVIVEKEPGLVEE